MEWVGRPRRPGIPTAGARAWTDTFWSGKRVCVTGGAGFLGRFVQRSLGERGVREMFVPQYEVYDLVKPEDVRRMLADSARI